MKKTSKQWDHDIKKVDQIINHVKDMNPKIDTALDEIGQAIETGNLSNIDEENLAQIKETNNQLRNLLEIAQEMLQAETDKTSSSW